MSEDTMVLRTDQPAGEVADYVARVRRALDDLRPDDVDELTMGMEADLAEIRAESDSLESRLGTPEAYAAELRAAAELPPRTAARTRAPGAPERAARPPGGGGGGGATNPALARLHAVLAPLAPAWWVLRGLAVAWAVATTVFFGTGWGMALVLLVLCVGGSVLVGRRTRRGTSPVGGTLLWAGNALALAVSALFLGFVVDRALVHQAPAQVSDESSSAPSGIAYNGMPVTNVFVYDEHGQPVRRARLLTQDGEEMWLDSALLDGSEQSAVDQYGKRYRNVFPVGPAGRDPWRPVVTGEPGPLDGQVWTPPTVLPGLLPAASVTPAATVAPTPGPATTTGGAPAPTASSSPSGTAPTSGSHP